MDFLWYLLIAVLSGVFAGMGMGGGTFLIPLITLLMNVEQNVAQCLNLLVFVPMAIITIIIYAKQKLIDFKNWWIVSIPACVVSTLGVLLAVNLSGKVLKIIFGGFIAIIGIVQIIVLIIKFIKQKKKNVKMAIK
ncbi:MAG: sulfite exporter TauE/SafE family protein [Clostridia bacterium]|nr:sulfite exporter TauE/SafE family protein [Clostridia bacterium]